jgi:translation initiation factor IF-3
VNDEIGAPQVRLIDQNGEMVGVVSLREALIRAYGAGLDLVEIMPGAVPPVCRVYAFEKKPT